MLDISLGMKAESEQFLVCETSVRSPKLFNLFDVRLSCVVRSTDSSYEYKKVGGLPYVLNDITHKKLLALTFHAHLGRGCFQLYPGDFCA